jgi:PIN domain nuclease of toxin-antitoxin system
LNDIYILDACALIALLSKETGYKNVEKIIESSNNKKTKIIMHTVNLLEVYYHLYKLYDEVSALNFLDEIKDSPIQLRAEVNNEIIINAGKLKRKYKLSLADAIGLAETMISNGSFVTADHHELDVIEKNENINFTWVR